MMFLSLTIGELFTGVAIVFDRVIQRKTTWADFSAVAAVATVFWVGLFELNSLAVFDRALMVVRQVKNRSS